MKFNHPLTELIASYIGDLSLSEMAWLDGKLVADRKATIERCAKIADIEEERHRKGSPVSSMAEDTWGAMTAKEIAEAIRDDRNHQKA